MGRDGREIWQRRVVRWRESGLTAKEFARETGINAGSLNHWAWKLRATGDAETGEPEAVSARPLPAAAWVEVVGPRTEATPAPGAATTTFELLLASGRAVRVPANFDADALRRLLAIVEGR